MQSKVKFELELIRSTGKYRVKAAVNSLELSPGQIVTAREVEELIARGPTVTIREAKR